MKRKLFPGLLPGKSVCSCHGMAGMGILNFLVGHPINKVDVNNSQRGANRDVRLHVDGV